MRTKNRILGALVAMLSVSVLCVPSVYAQVCSPKQHQTELQYLRRLSLDLRGEMPSVKELKAVVEQGHVTEAMIDNMLSSTGFVHQVREYHRNLLWPNVTNLTLSNGNWRFGGNGTSVPYYLTSLGRKQRYRGYNARCLNEPAKFDSNGNITCKQETLKDRNGKPYTLCREGYVKIKPYWAPDKEYKFCAYDAQQAESAKHTNGRTYNCGESTAPKGCGCGPNMRYCMTNTVQAQLTKDLGEQLLRFVQNIIDKKQPYTNVITGKSLQINGRLSHYLRYQTKAGGIFINKEQNYSVPALKYSEGTRWVEIQRKQLHAGVLTLPGFLLKFSANRSRANRFYNAFLCKAFQAPSSGLPPASDRCHDEPNLMKRCGCKYCHQSVEPAAAYWGRWMESGLAPLNLDTYPTFDDVCAGSSGRNNSNCRRFYLVTPGHPDEDPYRGKLRAYLFATPEMAKNIEQGPIGIAQKSIDSGAFGQCAATNVWQWLMGHAPYSQQSNIITKLAEQFKNGKYSFSQLAKAVVMSPEYKQGRLLNQ